MSIISTGRLKPIIEPFDNGWNYILDLSFKLISLLVIWLCKCNNVLKRKITCLGTLIIRVCRSTLNIFPQWISKPRIQKPKNHSKASSGAGRFAQNLRSCKKAQYNAQNCKSGRHNRRHTFRRCTSQYKPISTNIPYNDLMVNGRRSGNTKAPSPCRQNWMLRVLNHCQDITLNGSTKLMSSLLPLDESNMDNDHSSTNSGYKNHSSIIFPFHHALNQVDLSTNMLDKVI